MSWLDHLHRLIYTLDIAFKLNSMPRKMFDFKTPYNVEFNLIKSGAVEIT